MTTYLESASGVEDGGRTGLTAIATSVLFALMILFTPLALMVPGVATGPVLTIIGFQMLSSMRSIDYSDKTECLPAFYCRSDDHLDLQHCERYGSFNRFLPDSENRRRQNQRDPQAHVCGRSLHVVLSVYADLIKAQQLLS